MIWDESPRFEPRAMMARFSVGVKLLIGAPTLLKPEDILHVIEAGFLSNDPLRGAESAFGESFPAGGFMRQFQPLAGICKDNRVVANHVTAANRMHSYF